MIAGLVYVGEQTQSLQQQHPRNTERPPLKRLAPRVELYDQKSQLVKFERYLGRTRMVVIFFDGEKGADHDPWLLQLRDQINTVEASGVQVVGIGISTPYANREAEKRSRDFPFPILSDIGQDIPAPAHTRWGMFDRESGVYSTGVFLVDRSGMVEFERGQYQPVPDPGQVIQSICSGNWPE